MAKEKKEKQERTEITDAERIKLLQKMMKNRNKKPIEKSKEIYKATRKILKERKIDE